MTATPSRIESASQNDNRNSSLITSKASVESPATSWVSNKGKRKNPHSLRRLQKVKPAPEDEFELHYYSPYIAKLLNSKQPDVTAAVLLTNLSMWQNSRYGVKTFDGRRYSYRSLAQLTMDCPYFRKSSIRKALERVENALGAEFIVKRDMDVLHFSIGSQIMRILSAKRITRKEKEDNRTMKFSFSPLDAERTNSVRSAVLLGNLKHQLLEFEALRKDDKCNRYGRMIPSVLSPILGFSQDTIIRLLDDLCTDGYLRRHPDDHTFYRFAVGLGFGKSVNETDAEVNRSSAEVHARAAEVPTHAAKVHTEVARNASQVTETQWPPKAILPRYINGCMNGDVNGCIKDSIVTSSAPLPRQVSRMSKGLMTLMDLAEAKLAQMRSSQMASKERARVHQDELPYDKGDPFELPYEIVSAGERTFHAQVNEKVESMTEAFGWHNQKVTADDAAKFKRFFTDNPQIEGIDLYDLYGAMIAGPLAWISPTEMAKHPSGLLTKVRTPAQFLKYLPQIANLLDWDTGERSGPRMADEPSYEWNYAYMGRAPKSSIVSLDDGSVPIELVEE